MPGEGFFGTLPEMKKFAVIGHPIEHSRSPQLHEAGFIDFEIDAEFEAIDVAPEQLGEWLRGDFLEHYSGAAVTTPHKIAIRKFLDSETDAAAAIGAVNTITNVEGKIVGTNTDGIGALRAVLTEMDPTDARVLVLGAGGVARAIAFALNTAGAHVSVWNRTTAKAVKLAAELGVHCLPDLELALPIAEKIDLIVNATAGNPTMPDDWWSPHQVAFDVQYEPLVTKFLEDAEAAETRTITGDKLLVHQAIEQFKIWHGIEPEPEVFENAFFRG